MELEECETQQSGSDDGHSGRSLPPTPPSSASSDSEGAVSASCSPERRNSHSVQNIRGLHPRLYLSSGTGHGHSTRQPIHTSLISCQPVNIFIKKKNIYKIRYNDYPKKINK